MNNNQPPLLQQVVVVGVDGVQQVLADRILGEALVVDEEEYEKDGVRRREGDPGDHVDRLGHPDRVRWLLFPHLDEACLGRAAIVGRVRTGTGSAGTARAGHNLVRSTGFPFLHTKARFHQPTFVELGLDRWLPVDAAAPWLTDATTTAQSFLQHDAAGRSGRAGGGRRSWRLAAGGSYGSGRRGGTGSGGGGGGSSSISGSRLLGGDRHVELVFDRFLLVGISFGL